MKNKKDTLSSERKSLEKFLFENLSSVGFSHVARLERHLFSHDFRLSRAPLNINRKNYDMNLR